MCTQAGRWVRWHGLVMWVLGVRGPGMWAVCGVRWWWRRRGGGGVARCIPSSKGPPPTGALCACVGTSTGWHVRRRLLWHVHSHGSAANKPARQAAFAEWSFSFQPASVRQHEMSLGAAGGSLEGTRGPKLDGRGQNSLAARNPPNNPSAVVLSKG